MHQTGRSYGLLRLAWDPECSMRYDNAWTLQRKYRTALNMSPAALPEVARTDYTAPAIMDVHPAQWTEGELQDLKADYPDVHGAYDTHPSKYNPRPGRRLAV